MDVFPARPASPYLYYYIGKLCCNRMEWLQAQTQRGELLILSLMYSWYMLC